jgi:hypothetical protein
MGRGLYSLATTHLSSSIILEFKFIEICMCCREWRVGFVNRKKEKKGSVGPAQS